VKSVNPVTEAGLFAPMTPSGSLVVDGTLVSSYIGFEKNLSIAGFSFSHHWLSHSFKFPHRVACHYLSKCSNEVYNNEGVSTWDAVPLHAALWFFDQSEWVQSFFGIIFLPILGLMRTIEFLVL
jgi:hypothetical protein